MSFTQTIGENLNMIISMYVFVVKFIAWPPYFQGLAALCEKESNEESRAELLEVYEKLIQLYKRYYTVYLRYLFRKI